MSNKYDEIRKKNSAEIISNLNDSLSREVKKKVNDGVREIKQKITALPWDMSKKIIRTEDFISGTIAGKNVEFAFNESGECSTRIDGSLASFDAVNRLRKRLSSNDELITTLHSYLEEEDDEADNVGSEEKENKKDALDEADDFLSKIDLSELSKDAKLELIENIIDELQNSTDKDEFDDVMNEIYDLLDDYYVKKDEDDEEKPEEPEEESEEDENPEGEEEPIEGEEEPTEPVKPTE